MFFYLRFVEIADLSYLATFPCPHSLKKVFIREIVDQLDKIDCV